MLYLHIDLAITKLTAKCRLIMHLLYHLTPNTFYSDFYDTFGKGLNYSPKHDKSIGLIWFV